MFRFDWNHSHWALGVGYLIPEYLFHNIIILMSLDIRELPHWQGISFRRHGGSWNVRVIDSESRYLEIAEDQYFSPQCVSLVFFGVSGVFDTTRWGDICCGGVLRIVRLEAIELALLLFPPSILSIGSSS